MVQGSTAIHVILAALFGGLLTLLGTQLAQHHKWLFERRAEVFSKFLQMMEGARRSMSNIIYNGGLTKSEKAIKLNEQCQRVMSYVRIVRLYLPSDTRKEVYERSKDYIDRYSNVDLGDERWKKVNEDIDVIQNIFERELSAYFWWRSIRKWWTRIGRRRKSI